MALYFLLTNPPTNSKKGDDGGKELWLSILGQVYDVSAGPEYYAPGTWLICVCVV